MDYVPYSFIINPTGLPALMIPMGLNKEGLPIGIEIVGPHYSEPELLHIAKLLEPLTPKFQRPKGL
jgi:amidase